MGISHSLLPCHKVAEGAIICIYFISPYPYTSVISPGRAICWSILSSCDVAKLQVLSQLLQLTRLTIHVKSTLDMYMLQYKHICTNMGKNCVLQLLRLPVWGSAFVEQGEGSETHQDRKNPFQKGMGF